MTVKVWDIAEKYSDYVIEQRRKFHMYPERSLQEYKTCEMICEELKAIGLEPRVVCNTGVIVDIGDKSRTGKTACIRADIDALAVPEETGAEYASKNEGMMHACGHDAHTAMAICAAKILKELEDTEGLAGSVRIIFEPAEECARGANPMIAAGALDGVDTIYGTHVWGAIPAGLFSAEAGSRMASADFFTITIHGSGTHGSTPHTGVDPIAAAAALIQNMQSVFARRFNPIETALISFCQIHGGAADNAIPDTVTIGGTTRAFSLEVQEQFPIIMKEVIDDTTAMFGATGELDYRWGNPPMINDEWASEHAIKAVTKNFGSEVITTFPHTTGGEDFAEYQKIVPGVFVFLGVRNEEIGAIYPNHNSKFAMDESVLIQGSTAAVQYCIDFLKEE